MQQNQDNKNTQHQTCHYPDDLSGYRDRILGVINDFWGGDESQNPSKNQEVCL